MIPSPILQIVSGFAPDVDGMGDFSRHLGDALWAHYGIKSHFLIYRKSERGQPLISPNTFSYPIAAEPNALLDEALHILKSMRCTTVLLHYGPYAYARNGRPALIESAFSKIASQVRLIIFFHELYANGKPWRRAFWTHQEQKKAVERLLRSAQVSFTSNQEYLERLEALNIERRDVLKIPVISNIGEPSDPPALLYRARKLVIFGQLANRVRLYSQYGNSLAKISSLLRIERILDVGSGHNAKIPSRLGRIPVDSLGKLSDLDLSDLLSESIAGAIGYWPDVWEKSGVIAAYEAHRMVPILIPLETKKREQHETVPFVTPEELESSLSGPASTLMDRMQSLADFAHQYYLSNQSVHRCAETISNYISD
jgi:hypothetical protein